MRGKLVGAGRRAAIIVHNLAQAEAAVAAAAALGRPVTLLSAEGAAGSTGALYFHEMVALASGKHPGAEVAAVLDCADKPGHVLAGLRLGLKALRFSGRPAVARQLAAIAEEHGASLLSGRIEALDLLDEPDPATACRAWLGEPR